MKKIFFIVGLVALAIVAVILSVRRANAPGAETPPPAAGTPAGTSFPFATPKKSAHYESNTPAHGAILAAPPVNIVIDVNFDLVPPSLIEIARDQDKRKYTVSETIIDTNKLAMRRAMDPNAPDGLYAVTYNACWPDGSCHDGHFQFAINRSIGSSYLDLRGQSSVEVRLSQIKFQPMAIRINRGTTVVWQNDDEVEHYVNTDAHPSHTYFLEQNSKALKQGDTYFTVFNIPGAYPYHCSAHADTMKGSIIVER